MHPLLHLALAVCPHDYRERYAQSIARDASDRREGVAAVAWDLAYQGLVMRAENLARDASFAVRTLVKAPAYAGVAIATIAFAAGPNVAVASILSAVVVAPLPYPQADRIVSVGLKTGGGITSIPYLDSLDINAQTRTLEPLALIANDSETLLGLGRPRALHGGIVNGEFFPLFGARPRLGRLLDRADEGHPNAVISENTWRDIFAGDVNVIGRRMRFATSTYTVVGVTSNDFRSPLAPYAQNQRAAYWVALDPRSPTARSRGDWSYNAFARLRPGIAPGMAQADMDRLARRLAQRYPLNHLRTQTGGVLPVAELIAGDARPLLTSLYAAVTLILLIACANVANLTFVRGIARQQELVIRGAVGATRKRIIAQLSTEAAIVATTGGAIGLALGWAILRLVTPLAPQTLPRLDTIAIDGRTLAYTALLIVLTALLTGIVPALLGRRDIAPALKAAGRSGDRSRSGAVRRLLIIAEVALALTIAVSAGLIVRGFDALIHTPVGFDSTNLYEASFLNLPPKYDQPDVMAAFAKRTRTVIAAIPGVESVSAAAEMPFAGFATTGFTLPDKPAVQAITHINEIQPEYFATLRIPLLSGRNFTDADRHGSRPVAIVNATFARTYFGTLDVLGKRVTPGQVDYESTPPDRTIVGVVGDTRSVFALPAYAQVFMPLAQVPRIALFAIRTRGPIRGIEHAIDDAVAPLDAQIAPPPVASISSLMAASALNARAAMVLFTSLAAIALLLTLAGTYAVSAYSVGERMHEFGIRKAVGASSAMLAGDVLRGALAAAAIGIALGVCLAAFATRLLGTLLFTVSPFDPVTFGVAVLVLVLCTVGAALVPARRAARITPAAALRYE